LFDTLNIRKHCEPSPIKTGNSELLRAVYSLLPWYRGDVQLHVKKKWKVLFKQ